MSDAIKPTPGPWSVFEHSWSETSISAPSTDNAICLLDINFATEDSQEDDEAQMSANARLIAEAGTVFHETQLSPRQLLEQRDELLSALRTLHTRLSDCADVGAYTYEAYDSFYQALVHDAIAKCEAKP